MKIVTAAASTANCNSSKTVHETSLVPARMVNEWVYCPRLAYLEWVEGEWADSSDTVAGKRTHRRVDKGSGNLPPAEEMPDEFRRAQSVTLSSTRLGVIAKMDIVEVRDGIATPVDFKKGKRPHIPAGAYEPERVQLCVQAMILEDNGYMVDQGIIWFAGSRERVRVVLDDDLRSSALRAIKELRAAAANGRRPPPLEDSPKCPKCSLAGICLPDETNLFRNNRKPRQLNPSDDPALPLHIQTPGARLRKKGERLIIEVKGETIQVPMIDVSQVSLFGPVSVTTPALHALMRAKIPVSWFSTGGWFLGHTIGTGNGNIAVRQAQFGIAFDEVRSLEIACGLIAAKVVNSRTMLRRNWRTEHEIETKRKVLLKLKNTANKARHARSSAELLGHEGDAAAVYFSHFDRMLKLNLEEEGHSFSFAKRNRRPPTDPVNAMLSFVYAVLTRDFTTRISAVGLDPYQGMFHRARHGRPALALDLMEPFRSIVADSVVINVINNGEIRLNDFTFNGPACALRQGGRRAVLAAYERRMSQETTHPVFGYCVSMRRLIEVQVRLFARHLQGEITDFPHYLPR